MKDMKIDGIYFKLLFELEKNYQRELGLCLYCEKLSYKIEICTERR